MEFIFFVLLVIILVVLISMKGDVNARLKVLEQEIMSLQKALSNTPPKERFDESAAAAPVNQAVPTEKPAEERQAPPVVKPVFTAPPAATPVSMEDEALIARLQNLGADERAVQPEPLAPSKMATSVRVQQPGVQPIKSKPTFFERNPDLEKFIGENLVSKIGIIILVLAIAYFVKYAIDNNWIGPVGRVAVGMLCGGILIATAHRLRTSYKAFSSVLVGGGLAIFYFTITLGYHQFHLFSQTAAFIIMVMITGFAVALSLLYDRQEVAIIALVGGFATPFILSNGSGNYKTLFVYLIILNTGLLVLAYRKAWRLLNLLAFLFTILIFWLWLFALPENEPALTYRNGFVFATIFYLLYFVINLAHNIKENKKFIASDFGIILANSLLYFSTGLYCVYHMEAAAYKGLFSATMALFNLGVCLLLLKNKKTDINIVYLLIGITVTFISITAPLQFNGNFITLFWASEAVVLFALFQKSKIRIVETAAVLVWSTMLVSLVFDWVRVYQDTAAPLSIVANRGFITTVFAALTTYALFALKRWPLAGFDLKFSEWVPSVTIFRTVAVSLLYAAGAFEIYHQFIYRYPSAALHVLYLELYTFGFVLVFLWITSLKQSLKISFNLKVLLLTACMVIYLVCIAQQFFAQARALTGDLPLIHFNIAHYLMAVFSAGLLYKLVEVIRKNRERLGGNFNSVNWLVCIVIVVFLSVEFNHAARSLFYSALNPLDEIQRVYNKTVLPVLWGLCSFGFMWLGMKNKFRPLRIISLTLFSLTLLKLFLFDIRNIPVAGKIAAFFSLGVILLIISFMYQRLKKIIIDDEQKQLVGAPQPSSNNTEGLG